MTTTETNKRGNWTDEPCFYVDAIKDKNVALVAGPFRTEAEARALLPKAREEGYRRDPFSHFYAWGTCQMKDGHREGVLNKELGL